MPGSRSTKCVMSSKMASVHICNVLFAFWQNLLAPGVGSRNNFMPDGLLHSMPSQIRKQYPQIITYLQECSSGKNTNRIRSARRLRDILNIASKESPL